MIKDLDKLIEIRGVSKKHICNIVGITNVTLENKLTGATEWKLSELPFLAVALNMTNYQLAMFIINGEVIK